MDFGRISPKIKMINVINKVANNSPLSGPNTATNKTVATDEARMFTKLLPIKIVVIVSE